MLTNAEKSQIRNILQSVQWPAFERLKDLLIQRIEDQGIVKDSEWETIKSAIDRESQILGINRFFQELYKQAHDS